MLERLNGEDGLGAIFPAMVNALEALAVLGYPSDHPRRSHREARPRAAPGRRRLERLLPAVRLAGVGYGPRALWPCRRSGGPSARVAALRALDWLQPRQLLEEPGRLARAAPGARGRRLAVPVRQQPLPGPR